MKAFDFRREKDPVTAEMVIRALILSCRQLNSRPDLIVAAWLKSGIFVEADYVDAGLASYLPRYAGARKEKPADADGHKFWYLRPEDVLMTTCLKHLEKEAQDKENEISSYLDTIASSAPAATASAASAATWAVAAALSEGEEDASRTFRHLEREKRAAKKAETRREKRELALAEAETKLLGAKRAAKAEKQKEKRAAAKATVCPAVPAGAAEAAPDAGWAHASEAPKSSDADLDLDADDPMGIFSDDE